ncbi:dinitrogenase iron-molybdenum cofactor biosynthesis protein [candidate division KSB1 bacterium]|nr:dinitrogenase iron-molybdenum cofactor biosynthesis protein [candidate division KSB1 bacterium]
MKIAISATEKKLDAQVDSRFGRAPFFLIYDIETDEHDFIENTRALNAASGAGVQAAQNVVDSGVDAVLTGHCGPKAFRALGAGDISIYVNVSGSLRKAIEAFKEGEYEAAEKADVNGHWT